MSFIQLYDKYKLHYYIHRKNLQKIIELVENGYDIEEYDDFFCTPLLLALKNGNYKIAKYLISKGANLNAINNENRTILHYVNNKNISFMKKIITDINNINYQDIYGYTPLYMAIRNLDTNIVKFLISKGSNVNLLNDEGNNSILLLCYLHVWSSNINDACEIFKILIKSGANMNIINKRGKDLKYFAKKK